MAISSSGHRRPRPPCATSGYRHSSSNCCAPTSTRHDHDHVFTGRDGGLHRRSSFHRRHWRPATDGDPDNGIPAIIRELHFHDLRHSHKTWLIEDGVPEVARAKRLGHRLPGVRGIYSHVSATVEQGLAEGLQKGADRSPDTPAAG